MGRTLHWDIKPKEKLLLDIEDLKAFYEVDKKISNSCEWTCETFDLNLCTYPNWDKQKTWIDIDKRRKELLKEGLHPIEIGLKLVEEGITLSYTPDWQKGFGGFCKVGGNELNAMMVIIGLAAASQVVKCSINVSDEGKFLICPIIIENGMARPNGDRIDSNIAWCMTRRWDPTYKDAKVDWEEKARRDYEIKEKYRSQYCPPKCEWKIDTFCRRVNPKDFENHPEYGAAQIMAGFEGEYYGLTDKDPESESYRMTAFIQKMLPEGLKIEFAPKIGRQGGE